MQVEGPRTNKKGGEYFFVHIIGGGNKFTTIQNTNEVSESIGDLVNIAFESKVNGNFTNNTIKKIEILESGAGFVGQSGQPSVSNTVQAAAPKTTTQLLSKPNTGSSSQGTTPSKDVSMEVSGLLQALINRGTKTGDLESELRNVLRLKRQIANELEQTGQV